ncbi:MAG: fatty acyl-AMP ligase [Oscillatoriophycideae cyanobacterium NC_groundwater_1537_Pr4_S-0.65um_50_18]|nr:fatty acyl-AMP ligase [Oscillatoriophycideae cyanobacterium NC_groundwater_1537_Pr4_S-0.65um_50_18]
MTLHFDDFNVCTANQTLVDLLQTQAVFQPNKCVFTYVSDGNEGTTTLTCAELDARARAIAADLQTCTQIGDRALLLYPQGLEFIAAFFGCLYSGVVAVPAYPPHPSKLERSLPRLRSIAASAAPAVVLTTQAVLPLAARVQSEAPEFASPHWIATDGSAHISTNTWRRPGLTADSLAFLQYTSGSTAIPKGVMVSHGNLMHNERAMQVAFETTPETVVVGWLPLYHDMGLIGNVLHPLFMGASCVLMSPSAFIQRPLAWLELIDRHRATVSGGPNFAYELCLRRTSPEDRARLDLSSWRVAFNGAEPVRADTIDRFARAFAPSGFNPNTFFPCYGLAEATLFAAGGAVSAVPTVCRVDTAAIGLNAVVTAQADDQTAAALVGCGDAAAGQQIVIANPATETTADDDTIGEIWISGSSVAQGYWHKRQDKKIMTVTNRKKRANSCF